MGRIIQNNMNTIRKLLSLWRGWMQRDANGVKSQFLRRESAKVNIAKKFLVWNFVLIFRLWKSLNAFKVSIK